MRIVIYTKNSDVDKVFKAFEDFLKKNPIKENHIGLKGHSKLHQKYFNLTDDNYRQIINLNVNDMFRNMALNVIIELLKNGTDIRIAFKHSEIGDNIYINYEEIEEFVSKFERGMG